jgi:hypothetical protein
MTTMVLSVLGGAAGLGALLTPILVHITSRRQTVQTENGALIDALQEERDRVIDRLNDRDRVIAELWGYVHELRYWMAKGSVGEPPTMPEGLTVAAIRARVPA